MKVLRRLGAACIATQVPLVLSQQATVTVETEGGSAQRPILSKHLDGALYSTRFPDVTWDNDAWTLTSTHAALDDYRAQAFTANGYLGLSTASNGPFFKLFEDSSGWPLFNTRQTFATVSGFWDRQARTNGTNFPWLEQYGWDSAISGVPHWGPLILELHDGSYLDATVDPSQLSHVRLAYDFGRSLAVWQYVWTPGNLKGLSFNITYSAFADKLHVNRGYVRLQVSPSQDCRVTIVNVLDGMGALRTDFKESAVEGNMIYTAVSPVGVSNVTAWVYAGIDASSDVDLTSVRRISDRPYFGNNASSIAQGVSSMLVAGKTTTVTKYVGIASTDGFSDPQSQACDAALAGMSTGYDQALEDHSAEWASIFPPSSVTNFADPATGVLPRDLVERQIATVVSSSMLLMNTVGKNAVGSVDQAPIDVNGISVCGLTSDCYAGQKFWDEDVWMQPHIAAVFPFEAKQISNSRIGQYGQAKANAQTAYTSSKNRTVISSDAAVYPWTSGRDGNCTATGPCFDYEYHLNGDIAKSFVTYWATSGDSDFFESSLLAPLDSIATFYSDILTLNGSSYVLTNLTDPDEYANHVDNGGYTMSLMAETLTSANFFRELFGRPRNATWDVQASNMYIPFDAAADLTLEYSGMNGSIAVKQADVVLKIYPLEDVQSYTPASQLADLDYYAGKQSSDGPGMTYAIFSIGASEVSPSGCSAYTYDLGSWSPYVRAPWFQFSEQIVDDYALNGGTHPAYPFLTGHGGFLQVDLNGYLGLRPGTGFNLRVNPDLPPQIEHIAYPVFYHQGWPIEAVANRSHTTLRRLATPLATANMTFAGGPIAVQIGQDPSTLYRLPPNGTLALRNRQAGFNKTVPGNVAQCRPTVPSGGDYVPGQFPLAAFDGAISTNWQPTTAKTSQGVTVDLVDVPFQRVLYNYLDWAQAPPVNFTIIYHNSSCYACSGEVSGRTVIRVASVDVSQPYDATQASLVQRYQSNSTNLTLDRDVWTGNYATLLIEGNQADASDDAVGATVAEWAIVGSVGQALSGR